MSKSECSISWPEYKLLSKSKCVPPSEEAEIAKNSMSCSTTTSRLYEICEILVVYILNCLSHENSAGICSKIEVVNHENKHDFESVSVDPVTVVFCSVVVLVMLLSLCKEDNNARKAEEETLYDA